MCCNECNETIYCSLALFHLLVWKLGVSDFPKPTATCWLQQRMCMAKMEHARQSGAERNDAGFRMERQWTQQRWIDNSNESIQGGGTWKPVGQPEYLGRRSIRRSSTNLSATSNRTAPPENLNNTMSSFQIAWKDGGACSNCTGAHQCGSVGLDPTSRLQAWSLIWPL